MVARGRNAEFADTWESSAFAFEHFRNGGSGGNVQDLECPQVGESGQAVEKFRHQPLRGIQEM